MKRDGPYLGIDHGAGLRWLLVAAVALLLLAGAAAAGPCQAVELELQVGFWTGDWQLVEHRDLCRPQDSFLLARRGQASRRLRSVQELLSLVPAVRNEGEALALAAFLTDHPSAWSDFHCSAPKLSLTPTPAGTPGASRPSREDPEQPRLIDPDRPLPGDLRADPYALSVARKGPEGPFIIQRYLRCPATADTVILARETFGGGYTREELRVLHPGTSPATPAGPAAARQEPDRREPPPGLRPLPWSLETGGRSILAPENRAAPPLVLARGWDDDLRVERIEDFSRFVRIRNEAEALQYVRLLDALKGLLPGLDCFDPVKTPGQLLTERLHPQPSLRREQLESDLRLYRSPPGVGIDRSRLRLSRQGPRGPFVVERYLACMPREGKHRLVLAREVVGSRGEYRREELRVLAEGRFD